MAGGPPPPCSVPQFPLFSGVAGKAVSPIPAVCGEGGRAGGGGAGAGPRPEEGTLWSQYRVGQLYTISKHSHQESEKGEGVEVVKNEPHEDPVHGPGQFTEKRVHLSSKLPSWARAVTPRIFYITEKAWNYYPYTITEYTCSFLPKFSIYIETKYEDNCGDSENIFHSDKILGDHEVSFLDIAFDEIPERYYRSLEVAQTGMGEASWGDEPPDFLAPPKTRPRKKSAPETLTLPALGERAGTE
ncbi:PREDICTED: cytoplasmic phosphatidylinositol transfer protein 1-like [Calidris pugnax]|uniref:cytoplasmic phosphatidylinositol transfer protein 1-like n=1 Tax=Calidris pugnax TaxID=198806 RepID=UPI00071C8685|nr:PREDICTED: cytoplasmic phosphatidylinositol transfer protein 1-like [Calidris pugnax]